MASSDLLPETQALISSPHEGLFSSLTSLRSQPASYIQFRAWRSTAHSNPSLWRDLDRVQVLGDEDQGGYGHTGCVNALSWSQDGETLISSGDDCRLCVWRPPTSFSSTSSTDQFTCSVTLQTGHTGNVFAAHFLPHTSDAHVATCAADKQVRVFDVTRTTGGTSRPMHVRSSEAGGMRERSWEERTEGMCCLRVLRCHTKRTKRIVTEDSPNFFLTVSEDHTVRQHDLRTYHQCGSGGNCPAPMIKLPYSLSTIACSPITPWNFVVAGDSTFGHLFDRRMIGRILRHEWGQGILGEDQDENSTRCVRRFGRFKRGPKERKIHSHITAARMARTNGHELLLSYSGDAVYLYNIKDSPFEPAPQASSILLPNRSPPLSQSSSSKKPASPVSSPSTRKRKKVDIDRPVSPTWAFASATSQSGAGSGLETQPEAVDEEADHTPTEWQGIDEGSPRESIHHVDEIVTVDVDSLSNFARTGGLERLEVGTGGSDGAEVIGAEEAEVDSDEDEDEDENEDEDGAEGHEGSDDDDDFVPPEEEEEEQELGYVQELNTGAAWEVLDTPTIMPTKRYAGARNVETYKDVNFLGASDDYVCSGSDDGHFFVWSKPTANLVGIWEGDGSVVNVVEDRPAHHSFPMLAVSGIDHTVKIFAPTASEPRPFCHTPRAPEIIERNLSRGGPTMMRLSRIQMALLQAHLGLEGRDIDRADCRIM